ncbi:MAG: hypothetical protein WBO57_02855, partial [Gammaproteobacteria bacterium]
TTLIQVSISNDFDPSLAQEVTFVVNVTEPEPEDEPINPVNDTNNSTPVTTSSNSSTTDTGAEFIANSAETGTTETESEIIRESVAESFTENAEQAEGEILEVTEFDDTGEGGNGLVAAYDAEVAEIQALIAAGKDPSLYTPATAAGISKQLLQEASASDAQVAEILSIMEKATNLIGCGQ